MERQPQNPEFRINPEIFTLVLYLPEFSMESQLQNPEFRINPELLKFEF